MSPGIRRYEDGALVTKLPRALATEVLLTFKALLHLTWVHELAGFRYGRPDKKRGRQFHLAGDPCAVPGCQAPRYQTPGGEVKARCRQHHMAENRKHQQAAQRRKVAASAT